MTQAENRGESSARTSENSSELAYQAGTHFLSPKGTRTVRFTQIDEPTLEAAHSAQALNVTNEAEEVAWVEFYSHPRLRERGTPLTLIEEPHLAVDLHEGQYEFASLSTLLQDLSLPLYVSEWLARSIRASGDYSLTRSGRIIDPRFQKLPHMVSQAHPAFERNDTPSSLMTVREHATDTQKRLVQAAAASYPHLAERYRERGILTPHS